MGTLDLTKILKDCPNGTLLYSPIFGNVEFAGIYPDRDPYPIALLHDDHQTVYFTCDGRFLDSPYSELLLFPSNDNRDWSKWTKPATTFSVGDYIRYNGIGEILRITSISEDGKIFAKSITNGTGFTCIRKEYIEKIEQYGIERFKAGDAVLTRDDAEFKWTYAILSHVDDEEPEYRFRFLPVGMRYCIPYNDETKDLVGSTKMPSKFYVTGY